MTTDPVPLLVSPPLIDKRTPDDLVAQTQALAQAFTVEEVSTAGTTAIGRTLATDVHDTNSQLLAGAGTYLTATLLTRLSQAGVSRVPVMGWKPPGTPLTVPTTAAALIGRRL